jgi:hypothetical protein
MSDDLIRPTAPDPIFAALAAHKAAYGPCRDASSSAQYDAAFDHWYELDRTMLERHAPTTLAGVTALLRYTAERNDLEGWSGEREREVIACCAAALESIQAKEAA